MRRTRDASNQVIVTWRSSNDQIATGWAPNYNHSGSKVQQPIQRGWTRWSTLVQKEVSRSLRLAAHLPKLADEAQSTEHAQPGPRRQGQGHRYGRADRHEVRAVHALGVLEPKSEDRSPPLVEAHADAKHVLR